MASPEERFTGRVDDYARYRPGYPRGILEVLSAACGLNAESRIADIASGTGLLAEVFVGNGNLVEAVEPNESMLAVLAQSGAGTGLLRTRKGSAEATGLEEHSVDFVTVGQAMHWFDLRNARQEFARVLRPDGWCVVVYNERRRGGDAFHDGYEQLLRAHGSDYQEVQEKHLSAAQIAGFFDPCTVVRVELENFQELTLEGLRGRVASSSYMPSREHPGYAALLADIAALFERCAVGGCVRLEYVCALSYGHLRCD